MTFLIWLVILLAALAATLFIRVTYVGKPIPSLLTKAIASIAFIAVGLLCAAAQPKGEPNTYYSTLVILGLCFGFIGDVALAYREVQPNRADIAFKVGLGSFLVGHIFYAIVFAIVAAKVTFLQIGIALGLYVVLLIVQGFVTLNFGKMKLPVYLYGAVISIMVAFAIGAAAYAPSLQTGLILAGGVLFLVSDAILAVIYFGKKENQPTSLRAFNLSTYYLAQILLAISIWVR